jgi:hypothetical protein
VPLRNSYYQALVLGFSDILGGAKGTVDAGLDKKSGPLAADDILLDGRGSPFKVDTGAAASWALKTLALMANLS